MASVGVLSARPRLTGAPVSRSAAGRTGKVRTVVRAEHQPGINMPEGDADALNKWSRKITQPKSQGASQVRPASVRIERGIPRPRGPSFATAAVSWFRRSIPK